MNTRSNLGGNDLKIDGTVTAECEALVGPVPEEFRARWEPERPYWRIWDD